MKSLIKPTFATVLAVTLLGVAVSAQAQDNKTDAKPTQAPPVVTPAAPAAPTAPAAPAVPEKPKREDFPFHGKVASVDKAASTVTLEGKDHTRVLQVAATTKITKDGKPATLADVTVGEKVTGSCKKTADGKEEALSLYIGGKAKTDAKKETKKAKATK